MNYLVYLKYKHGSRKSHIDLDIFSETAYLEIFPKVEELVKSGEFASVFDHFCKVGYVILLDCLHNENDSIYNSSDEMLYDEQL